MRILTYCAAALFAGTSLSTLHAQNVGDVTATYLTNPGFELGNAAENYTDLGTQNGGGGQRHQPTGWIFQTQWSGWNDGQVYAATPTEPDGTYLSTYAGNYAFNAWAGDFTYANLYQEVALPAGFYNLTAAVRMTNNETELLTDQNLYVKTGTDSLYTAFPQTCVGRTTTGTIDGYWQVIGVEFSLGDAATIRFGVSGSGTGTGSAGWFQCDDFKLEFLGGSNDPVLYAKNRLATLINDAKKNGTEGAAGGYSTKIIELTTQYESLIGQEGATADDFNAAYDALKVVLTEMEKSKAVMTEFAALDDIALDLKDNTSYPGKEDFIIAETAAFEISVSDESFIGDIEQAIADLTAAIKTYKLSQVATLSDPADFTFMVSCPSFTKEGGDASLASDRLATNWEKGNVDFSGDARTNTVGGKNCYNVWTSGKFTTLDIHQDITGLPVGLYSVSALTTADEAPAKQHVYATSTAGTAVSANATTWFTWTVAGTNDFAANATWEGPLATDKILVTSDGKLRIGMVSPEDGGAGVQNGRLGWFCVTDFVLSYYGKESAAEAYTEALAAKIANAEALATKEMLPSETTALQMAIAAAKAADASTVDAMEATMTTLNVAIAEADTAVLAMNKFKAGSYATLIAQIDNDNVSPKLPDLVGYELDLVDAAIGAIDATSEVYASLEKELAIAVLYGKAQLATTAAMNEATEEGLTTLLISAQNNYDNLAVANNLAADTTSLKTYTKELTAYITFATLYATNKALGSDEATYGSEACQTFNAAMEAILPTITDFSKLAAATTSVYDAVSELKSIPANPGDDLTDRWIVNPETTATGNSDAMTGWSITKTDGNTFSATGQHWTGDTSRRYLDSWNATAGKLQYVAQQSIVGLPNGTYKIKCAGRSSGLGAFLYALTGNDTIKIEIPNNVDTGGNIWTDAEEGSPEKLVHDGVGYGWNWVETPNINVGAKELIFGVTTKNTFTHSTWTGNWFSASDFKLIYVSADYTETGGVSIDEVSADGSSSLDAYVENGYIVVPGATTFEVTTIAGAAVNAKTQLAPGIYVVKAAGKVAKVAVK